MQCILPHTFLPYAYDSQIHHQRKLIYHTYSHIVKTANNLEDKKVIIILNLWLATTDASKVAKYFAESVREGDVDADVIKHVWNQHYFMEDVRRLGSDWYPKDPNQALIEVGKFNAWKKNYNIKDPKARDYEPTTAG